VVLTELYNVASRAAREGAGERAAALFEAVCELAEMDTPSLAGKAFFKRAQLARHPRDRRQLLEQALALCPEHLEARRQLSGLAGPASR
jgi:hypothetical protein